MKIETKASSLTSDLQFLARISKLNSSNKSILIDAQETSKLYSSSGLIYGQTALESRVVETGKALIPLKTIDFLNKLKETVIEIEIDLNKIVISSKAGNINLTQSPGTLDEVSNRAYEPNWLGWNISRIKNIRYASGNFDETKVFWFYDGKIIATDKHTIAILNLGYESDRRFLVPNIITSFISIDNDDVDIAVEKELWLGNSKRSVSIATYADFSIPTPLVMLSELETSLFPSAVFSTAALQQNMAIVQKLTDEHSFAARVKLTNEYINLSSGISMGDTSRTIPVIESFLGEELSFSINATYLHRTLTNCTNPQVILGFAKLGNTPLLFIQDYDITHYIITLV